MSKYVGKSFDLNGDTYQIECEIGQGGNGTVFRVGKESTGEKYVIKILTTAKEGEKIERFSKEISFGMNYHHNNIVEVLGSGVISGCPFYMMPLYKKSLRSLMAEKNTDLELSFDLINQICKGLAFLH